MVLKGAMKDAKGEEQPVVLTSCGACKPQQQLIKIFLMFQQWHFYLIGN